MEQINGYIFYWLARQTGHAYAHARWAMLAWIESARSAKATLDTLLQGEARFTLDESHDAAQSLSAGLAAIIEAYEANEALGEKKDPAYTLADTQVAQFNTLLWAFESALALELGRAPLFYVTPKGAYDTRRLITNAASMYEGYLNRLPPEAIDETNYAGRCLAFDLNTASGFHIARATEAVIKRYMEAYGCPPIKESQRNWGVYTAALAAKGANEKIVNHIDQLRRLHRNPVTHPDVTLNRPAALALQAMCQSVIQAMVADIETKMSYPDPGIVAMLPPPEVEADVT